MEMALTEDVVVPQIWSAYKKSIEYNKQGMKHAIPSNHRIVIDQEKLGLKAIYLKFVDTLRYTNNLGAELKLRKVAEWLQEWREMHSSLFQHVLKEKGSWRKVNVRFGDPGDEELYKIPHHNNVYQELCILADEIKNYLSLEHLAYDDKYKILAKVHYQFIRIHPFVDGNGRIARAITDQLAIYFDFPVAMGGYPRHNPKNRQAYHKAIHSCIDNPECEELAMWIRSYIDKQIEQLA